MKEIIGSIFFLGISLVSAKALAQCGSDTDCKGDRICVKSKCVYQDAATPPLDTIPVAPPPSAIATVQQQPTPPPAVSAPPVPIPSPMPAQMTLSGPELAGKARPGIVTGSVFNAVGLGLFLVGGAVVSANLGAGLILAYSGGGLVSIGSLIGTASYTVKHGAYVDAGFRPSGGRKAGAWTLTILTLGSFGGGLGVGMVADGLGAALASIGLNGLGVILEVINWLSVRPKWNQELINSSGAQTSLGVRLFPSASVAVNPSTCRKTPLFGIAGVF